MRPGFTGPCLAVRLATAIPGRIPMTGVDRRDKRGFLSACYEVGDMREACN